ncbi:MAG: tRNA (guanosine(46)-N7)-methyltransferase TrmB [Succinatimonas sp.]|nr:tRNA (guanosine(46)-N7)-methyltransferase TrmB [Succinatimonas sp.]
MENENLQDRHIKSYVVRAGRITAAQTRALAELGPKYLVAVEEGKYLNPTELFGREAPLVVEIGFGMGKSFTQMAQEDPNSNYLGIEVHPPGVGSALMLVEELGLKNVRIIQYDAFEIFKHHLREECIDILQVFFPDPWPKKRHFKRRLINDDFISMVAPSLKHGGLVRLATDWEEYAMQMLDVMTRASGFSNTASNGSFIDRPAWRPLTKFELRGERLGHGVWDLVFKRD